MTLDLNDKQIRILLVAEKLFAEKGFDGTSIRNISKDAKINIAMVSYYFGSKEKMLESLIYFRTSDLKMQLENLYQEAIEPMEKINKLIDLYITRINKNKCIYQILHFELSNKKRAVDIKSFTEVKRQNLISLEKIITEGQEKGIFKKDINVILLPPTILGTFFHFQMNRPYFEELLDLRTDEAFDNYIKTDLTKHIKQTIKALLINEI
ncbi:TetR family transcriptional regulator [Flavobacterium noncentrifugens]|uniref:Transcriptional regulator, TetR family n=1 Tax=Flavobacterium noncentrifugens TaxID=1128970 RepID=A0A1G8W5G5_9FLAO|nr:TetR family transcriptional regulator [Flavobacterium noncentrifugens]GEP50776.1 TetR family transcriptional regulator [Flavobacterium noncentrifugens]SDJ73343.1 transcriptional regulator, TetR family [Flavobacterium noncentrifugens]